MTYETPEQQRADDGGAAGNTADQTPQDASLTGDCDACGITGNPCFTQGTADMCRWP